MLASGMKITFSVVNFRVLITHLKLVLQLARSHCTQLWNAKVDDDGNCGRYIVLLSDRTLHGSVGIFVRFF